MEGPDGSRPSFVAPVSTAAPPRPAMAPSGSTQPRSWRSVRAPAMTTADCPVAATTESDETGPSSSSSAMARSMGPSTDSASPACMARAGRPVVPAVVAPGPGSRSSSRSTSSSSRPTSGRAGVSRNRARQPAVAHSDGRPGAANTARPCSRACRAVMSAPLPMGASMTSVARLSPLMMRLRRGKVPRVGAESGGCSPTMAPPEARMAAARPACARGPAWASPPPMTATVRPLASSVAAWATPSMPMARPLTTVTPRTARAAATRPARERPVGVGRLVPTIATSGSASIAAASPAPNSTGGGGSMTRNAAGNPGSHGARTHASISRSRRLIASGSRAAARMASTVAGRSPVSAASRTRRPKLVWSSRRASSSNRAAPPNAAASRGTRRSPRPSIAARAIHAVRSAMAAGAVTRPSSG